MLFTAISVGWNTNLALGDDGRAYGSGDDQYGHLADSGGGTHRQAINTAINHSRATLLVAHP